MSIASQNEPVLCGEVVVRHGDLIVLDDTGVAVIPSDSVGEVLDLAEAAEQRDSARAKILREQPETA